MDARLQPILPGRELSSSKRPGYSHNCAQLALEFLRALLMFLFRLAVMLVGHASGGDQKRKSAVKAWAWRMHESTAASAIPSATRIVCGPVFLWHTTNAKLGPSS